MSNHTLLGLPLPIAKLVDKRLKQYNRDMFTIYANTKQDIYQHIESELRAQRILMYVTITIFSVVIGCFCSLIIWCIKRRKKKRTR